MIAINQLFPCCCGLQRKETKLLSMRITRTAHWVLAAIFLVQSVVAVATVTPMAQPSDSSQLSSIDIMPMEPEGKAPCHGGAAEDVKEPVNDCCASMEEPCCEFGCAAPGGIALPANTILLTGFHHPAFVASSNNIHLHNLPAGLFRPPRPIQ